MKMSDIRLGEIYDIGENQGRQGVRTTGMRGRVVEKDIGAYAFSSRKTMVRVQMLDDEGNDRVNHRGEPFIRTILASEILSPEKVKALRAEREQKEAERRAFRERDEKFQIQVKSAIKQRFGIDGRFLWVGTRYVRSEDRFVAISVRLVDSVMQEILGEDWR